MRIPRACTPEAESQCGPASSEGVAQSLHALLGPSLYGFLRACADILRGRVRERIMGNAQEPAAWEGWAVQSHT